MAEYICIIDNCAAPLRQNTFAEARAALKELDIDMDDCVIVTHYDLKSQYERDHYGLIRYARLGAFDNERAAPAWIESPDLDPTIVRIETPKGVAIIRNVGGPSPA